MRCKHVVVGLRCRRVCRRQTPNSVETGVGASDRPRLVNRPHQEGGLANTSVQCAAVLRIAVGIVGDEEGSAGLLGEVGLRVSVRSSDVCGTPRNGHLVDGEELPLILYRLEVRRTVITVDIGDNSLLRCTAESEILRRLAPTELDYLPTRHNHVLALSGRVGAHKGDGVNVVLLSTASVFL